MADGREQDRPASGAVEDLLRVVEATDPAAPSFTLWVPESLAMGGHPVRPDVAMAVVLDRILGRGFEPAGFEEHPSGRLYRYEREADA
ncbi:hypothetical protein OJF2_41440 [Aquisphaera giovannonii]|uniref:Uncharacterized protein n=1 Tax=Aquisphaera giovannonii TaxID=406548 RepID=A0A5B9W6J2_9BACT|nr:hypothetical protein [Aquisphaera giovannonii]QEH35591.1 hypothetical protein OJF2_41440 [Aquisphaera giovannonii]